MVLTLCNMVYLCYSCFGASMLFMMCIHLRLSITVIKSGSNPAYSRRQSTPSVMANYCLVILPAQPQDTVFFSFLLSSFFFFLTQSQSATVFCICTISFFCQHFKVLYLRHDSTDIDQTWSQVPVDHPIYVI